jgi:hypothetical protein
MRVCELHKMPDIHSESDITTVVCGIISFDPDLIVTSRQGHLTTLRTPHVQIEITL